MKRFVALAFVVMLCGVSGAAQQRSDRKPESKAAPRAQAAPATVGHGHIPQHGPQRVAPTAVPRSSKGSQHPDYRDQSQHPDAPHVHAKDDRWVGVSGANDPRYHLGTPWQHGHFPGAVGHAHIYRLQGGTSARFDCGGYFFSVAPADQYACGDWLWNSDDIVIYADPNHTGWYLAYDVRLGTYVHVVYLGPA